MANSKFNFVFPSKSDEEEDEDAIIVACPACKGGKKCASGNNTIACPLCEGDGEIELGVLLEFIVESLCEHTELLRSGY